MTIAPIAPLDYERYGILFNPILIPVPLIMKPPIPSREVGPVTAAVAPHYRDAWDGRPQTAGGGLANTGDNRHPYRGRRVNLIA